MHKTHYSTFTDVAGKLEKLIIIRLMKNYVQEVFDVTYMQTSST